MRFSFSIGFVLFFITILNAQVSVQKEDEGILFTEKGKNVLFYRTVPKNYQGEYERNNYIHPLWGTDGTVFTEDFPVDHLHHRGIFWAWHQVWVDGKRIGDPWAIENFEQKINGYSLSEQKKGPVSVTVNSGWYSDLFAKSGNMQPYIEEKTTVTVHPVSGKYRRIDFEISLLALTEGVSIGGSEDEKGYSGFSVRMVLQDDVAFTGIGGTVIPENTAVESPGYVNVSGSMGKAGKKAGIVMVDNPDNPGYPQPWILRDKSSMQNALFPGRNPVPVSVSEPLVLKYSLLVYSGKMNDRNIKKAMGF